MWPLWVAKSKLPVGILPPKKLAASDECFYVRDTDDKSESSPVAREQADLLRQKLEIHVKGGLDAAPIFSFASCNLPVKLLHNLETSGYDMPTPVQMQAIPAASMGKSLLVSADTGSGKSASFLIPIISCCTKVRIQYSLGHKRPLAIVLTPTRELSIQVEEHAKMLGQGLPFKTSLVVGGDAMAGQLHRIQQGVELIVGTPGRLIDLLIKNDIELNDVMIFVVDEVLMYSATISKEIEKMANSMAKDVVIITVGKPNKPNKAVKQLAIWVDSKQKKQKLFDILMSKQHFMPPVVVYVGSRLGADLLSNAITVTTGIKALSIHGEKSMKERREIMRSLLVGEVPVVVATGVLGRGVDLLGVSQVIVFDMPNSIKEYVHQIGRASRMGEEGQAIAFVNKENKSVFADLVDVLKSSGAAVPREILNSRYTVGFFSGGKRQKRKRHGC
ncbi:DEAD-box ATP-dependent RNA helicase [Quillaja saponaria]|uniref:RNA helicase n=1 Tax=Quillaja saponaria TaxID=32244 RepID=A0AAD7PZ04_QUISA|nr:DEAD-box ATP-dependent RNA helicase [Quillaja saponaria]